MRIERIQRLCNTNCNFTIRKCPRKWRLATLPEITNYLSTALNITLTNKIILDMSVLRSEIKLYIDTYENLKNICEILSKSTICQQHNDLNCQNVQCKSDTNVKKLDIRNDINLKN